MDFRLLGPLEVDDGDGPVGLGGAKPRALLALLLLNANLTVASDRLIDELWGDDPPESARKMVQIYVSQLRKFLPAETLSTHASGYALSVADGELDLDSFRALASGGRAALAAGDADRAARLLHRALAMWRGPALAEFDEHFARIEATRLEELRLAALEDRIDADLALGRHADLVAELEPLVREHPERERLRGQHMLALYRCGRQADALDTYHEGRRVLDEQLGLRPSSALRELEERILRQDPALAPPRTAAPTAPPSPVPRPQSTTRYARNGDVSLGYQVFGDGELELMLTTGWVLPMELAWDDVAYVRFLERLGSFSRVLMWDKRGTGLSDRFAPGELPSLEERMSDLLAVMDAAGFERAALLGCRRARCCRRGSLRPIRSGRSRWPCTAAGRGRSQSPTTPGAPHRSSSIASWRSSPTAGGTPDRCCSSGRPMIKHDVALRAWWNRALHLGASPTAAVQWLRLMVDHDIRDTLPSIRVPTLVVHRARDPIVPAGHGRFLADQIPGAQYVEIPGANHLWWVGDHEQLLEPVQEFLTGSAPAPAPERVLMTVLFTDIVDSTRRASEAGDRAWRFLQSQHDRAVRSEIARHDGREIKAMGDGFLATFDGPTRAVRCAAAIRDAAAAIGLDVRSGLHTGEVELVGDDIAGIAVNIGARVCALAGPGEVLVSRTVVDLVAGSGLEFEPRGEHELAGLPGSFTLLALQR